VIWGFKDKEKGRQGDKERGDKERGDMARGDMARGEGTPDSRLPTFEL
jgi:hypothetical protein